jgi:hypothetical protein
MVLSLLLAASPAVASQVQPHLPLPAGIPDRDTPGTPAGEGMRYGYPYVTDRWGRFGLLDFCRDWGAQCGKPAADAFCRQVDGGARPRAADFAEWKESGQHAHTVIISTRDSCELQRCSAFAYIVCRK